MILGNRPMPFVAFAVSRSLFLCCTLALFFLTAYVNGALHRRKDADVLTFIGVLIAITSDALALRYMFGDKYFPSSAAMLDFSGGIVTSVGIYFIRYHRVWDHGKDHGRWYHLQGAMIALSILVGIQRGFSMVMHAFWPRIPKHVGAFRRDIPE